MAMAPIWAAIYFLIGAALGTAGQVIAPDEDRSLGGFLWVACLWPIFVTVMVIELSVVLLGNDQA
jgi:hypothetical protein